MKKLVRFLLIVVLSFVSIEVIRGVSPSTRVQSLAWAYNPAVSVFDKALQPYGKWVSSRDYGSVWKPHKVSRDWRPYTRGRWIFTDYGWTWVSYEPWGWACFHYGRWYSDSIYGWVWYPDTVWAPAWVFWCTSDNWIGWAPIPPWLTWRHNDGFDLKGINLNVVVPLFSFSFCEGRHFLNDDLHSRIIVSNRNSTVIRRRKISLDINKENNRIVNHLPAEGRLAKLTGHPITKYKIRDVELPATIPLRENQLMVFRPNPEITTRPQFPPYPKQDAQGPFPEPQQPQVKQRELSQERQVQKQGQESQQQRIQNRKRPQHQEVSEQSQAPQQEVSMQQQAQQQNKTKKREKEQQDQRFSQKTRQISFRR